MIILKNASVIGFYPPSVEDKMDVIIEGHEIIAKGRNIASGYKEGKVYDMTGKYISSGLVCSHNHFYSALARGITADIKPARDFAGILKNLWWRLDCALDEESLYFSGLIGALEAIRSGTTCVIDHNASPSFIKGSLGTLKKCFETTGLRGILAYEVTDRNGKDGAAAGIEESIEFIESLKCGELPDERGKLIEGAIGAHALFTLSNETLKLLSGAVYNTGRGIHMHTAEDSYDSSFSHHFYNMDIIERLEIHNLLNDKTVLAHGVHLNENEIDLINKHGSFLVHNPRSNMNNSVGYSDKLHLVNNLAIGTDGIGSDMFEEIKTGFYKNSDAKGKLSAENLLRALQNGNILLERYFGGKFGKIEKGHAADIVVYNYDAPTSLLSENLGGHIIFGLSSKNVETVIINGNIVLENRQFPFDTKPLYEEARLQAKRLWGKISSRKY